MIERMSTEEQVVYHTIQFLDLLGLYPSRDMDKGALELEAALEARKPGDIYKATLALESELEKEIKNGTYQQRKAMKMLAAALKLLQYVGDEDT